MLLAVLAGWGEVPAADLAGWGSAHVSVSSDRIRVCYLLTVSGLAGTVVAAHIHKGAWGVNGPVVVVLVEPAGGSSAACVSVDAALGGDIARDPYGYYVNVHTSAFPDGAIRGQLHGGHP